MLQVNVHADDLLYLGESKSAHLLKWIEESEGEKHTEAKESAGSDELDDEHAKIACVDDAFLFVEDSEGDHAPETADTMS